MLDLFSINMVLLFFVNPKLETSIIIDLSFGASNYSSYFPFSSLKLYAKVFWALSKRTTEALSRPLFALSFMIPEIFIFCENDKKGNNVSIMISVLLIF